MLWTSSSQLVDGLGVDFDHAGVGRHLDAVDARVVRRGVAFDEHREARDRSAVSSMAVMQFEIIFEIAQRRHEDAQDAVAHFDAEGGADQSRGRIRRCGGSRRSRRRSGECSRSRLRRLRRHGAAGRSPLVRHRRSGVCFGRDLLDCRGLRGFGIAGQIVAAARWHRAAAAGRARPRDPFVR